VVPLDPTTRANVDDDMYGRHERFGVEVTLQSAEAYYGFRPEEVVGRLSPRPLLLVHGAQNPLHPIEEAYRLYCRAGEPKQLIELPTAQHLDWIQPGNPHFAETVSRIIAWLAAQLMAGSCDG
jgi:hypothetical protein